jgi:ribulose kinase
VNIDTATIRWFYNARRGGWPQSLYRKVGLEDLFAKVPGRIVKIGEVVGGLSLEMARATGLKAGIPVAGGGADAYMGVIGINALTPGTIALITGSSHLQVGITDREIHARGLFGSFPEALVPGLEVIEAGQISTGSVVRWFTSNFVGADIASAAEKAGRSVYDELNSRAASIPPGSEGLVVLEHWQGNRTPWTDPWSRGVIRGLTLGHGPAHVYRAILEGVAFGTEVILRKMAQEGVRIDKLVACGGATQSPLWMQIHADVSGKRILIPEEQQAVTLGSAIAGAVAAGVHPSLTAAAAAMVRVASVVEPEAKAHARYAELVEHYAATYESLKEASRRRVEAG